jgi:hypothetical protein
MWCVTWFWRFPSVPIQDRFWWCSRSVPTKPDQLGLGPINRDRMLPRCSQFWRWPLEIRELTFPQKMLKMPHSDSFRSVPVHKTVYIKFMNGCKICVIFTETSFYSTEWLCSVQKLRTVLKETTYFCLKLPVKIVKHPKCPTSLPKNLFCRRRRPVHLWHCVRLWRFVTWVNAWVDWNERNMRSQHNTKDDTVAKGNTSSRSSWATFLPS